MTTEKRVQETAEKIPDTPPLVHRSLCRGPKTNQTINRNQERAKAWTKKEMMEVHKRVPRTVLTNRPQARKQAKTWSYLIIQGMRFTRTTATLKLSVTTDRRKANTNRGGGRIIPSPEMIHPTSVNDIFGARF